MNLLKISVYIDDDCKYHIAVKKLHPDVKPSEYIRFAPYYLSFRLFADELPMCRGILDDIVGFDDRDFSSACANKLAGLGYRRVGNTRELDRKRYIYYGTLSFVSAAFRRMRTSIPFFGYKPHHSFISTWAVISCCIEAIDPSNARIMLNCFKIMDDQYSSGLSYKRIDVMHGLPNHAYNESVLLTAPES